MISPPESGRHIVRSERMREVLLHGGANEAFDRSVDFAKRLAESFGARLHVLYTVDEPLSAGWTAEVTPDKLPEIHQAIEEEARERLAQIVPNDEQERLGVEIVIAIGPAEEEIVRYVESHAIDLAIIRAPNGDDEGAALAGALVERGRCALLVLR
jgi:nucleotide-binding universal stress UspA family protein